MKLMNEMINENAIDLLCDAILSLESKEECRQFLKDVCSEMELRAITQRIVVAKMLSEKCVYNQIIEETGASTATISRVNKSLEFGANGYRTVLGRIGETQKG